MKRMKGEFSLFNVGVRHIVPIIAIAILSVFCLLSYAAPNSSSQKLQLTAYNPNSVDQKLEQYDPQHLFSKPDALEDQAFHNVSKQAMPMTPAQILKLKKMLAVTQSASAALPGTPPKPTLSTQIVSLSPGSSPPVIRLQQGFVTSVVFVDDTGQNWPIDSYDLGNSQAFNIQMPTNSNMLMIQALSRYTYGNLAVKLQGLSTPVMLTLVSGQQAVDYRADLQIQAEGPNAKPIINNQLPKSANNTLLSVLDGVSPDGSTVLTVSGGDSSAWLLGDKMYLRTKLTVLSPSWIGIMTSSDGTKAYEMEKSSTVLVSRYGKPIELRIEGL